MSDNTSRSTTLRITPVHAIAGALIIALVVAGVVFGPRLVSRLSDPGGGDPSAVSGPAAGGVGGDDASDRVDGDGGTGDGGAGGASGPSGSTGGGNSGVGSGGQSGGADLPPGALPWDQIPVDPADPRPEGTVRMAWLLASLAEAGADAESIYVADALPETLLSTPEPIDELARVQYDFQVAQSFLNTGDPERAVEQLDRARRTLLDRGAQIADSEDLRTITSLQAIAWLRLGEVENCQLNHSVDSCLLPITGDGVHGLRRGAEGALPLLSDLARSRPDDLTHRWLLNVAHMALGDYPDRVPAEVLIDPALFESDTAFPRFYDIAPLAGVAVPEMSGGSVMDDFDGDGLLDLMVSSWGADDPLRLFINRGDGTFEDVSETAGLSGITGGLNMVHADYDNDGDLDVLILRGAWRREAGRVPNSLLRNEGDGTFVDVTHAAGLLDFHPTQTAAWGDFDLDGHLDLVVGNESFPEDSAHPVQLFHNQGDGTFKEIGALAGVDVRKYVKGVVWGDYDNDGDPDLYLSSILSGNTLLRNDGADDRGQWRFTDVTDVAGVARPILAFPTWFFDYDNDGWLDLFVSGFSNAEHIFQDAAGDVLADYLGESTLAERARLYRNRGDGTFEDVSEAAGVADVVHSMGANFGDLDNDGWPDYLLGTGEPDFRALVPNRAYRNDEGRGFLDVTTAGGFGHLQKGHAISFGDLDNDGDQDVHVTIGGAYPGDWYFNALYENPGAGGDNAWVTLVLQGTRANRSAIGARVTVEVDDPTAPGGVRSIHGVVGSGGSFGANSLQLELGLGQATAIRRVVVRWPSRAGAGAGDGDGDGTSGPGGQMAPSAPEVYEGLEMRAAYRLVERAGGAGSAGVERLDRITFDLTPGLADGERPVYPTHEHGRMPGSEG